MDLYERFKIPEPKPFGTGMNIHVAEAHNELRLIIQHHLSKLGYQNVQTSRDGSIALAELKHRGANIAIVGDDLTNLGGLDPLFRVNVSFCFANQCKKAKLCSPWSRVWTICSFDQLPLRIYCQSCVQHTLPM
jgi:hypothetical protein